MDVKQHVYLLPGYADCMTGFREPLLPPYKCRTSLKNVQCYH